MNGYHPVIIAENHCYTTKGGCIVSPNNPLNIKQERNDLKDTIARLNERSDEPLVTAGTVTGAY